MSEKIIGETVYSTLDLDNLPPLTADELRSLALLREKKDEDIDFSDIPSQAGRTNWTRPGKFGGPVGGLRMQELQEKSLVLDDDVRELFAGDKEARAQKMNAVLREYGQAERKRA